jgi:RND superfamily putative drug exporter
MKTAALTGWLVRRRVAILVACLLLAVSGGLYGRGLFARMSSAAFRDPDAESSRGAELAHAHLGEGEPDVVALYQVAPEDPLVHAALAEAMERVRRDPAVGRVVGPTGPLPERFVSADRRSGFVVLSLRGSEREKLEALPRLRGLLRLRVGDRTIDPALGGLVPTARALTSIARTSLGRGEAIGLPLVALLLWIIFRSAVAAFLPVAVGGLAIVLSLALLSLLAHVIPVDAFAVNVVTILGLGVAIDYALFIVDRYRGERRKRTVTAALEAALATAGRSVLFSAVTVAASLAGLLVFRPPFLRSIAFGGMAVTLLAATLSLVALPAALSLLGARLERGRLPSLFHGRVGPDRWQRLASRVIRRRLPVTAVVCLLLLVLAAPFRRINPSRADVRALPPDEEAREVAEHLGRDFPRTALVADSLLVVMDADVLDRLGELFDYQERVAHVPGVVRVESVLSFAGVRDRDQAIALAPALESHADDPALRSVLHDRYVLLRAVPATSDAARSRARVQALRQVLPPPRSQVLVYGQAATLDDFARGVRERVPWMLALVGASMFAILFVAFQSLILPLKAMVLTALSLSASFGATVFVFQDGRLQRLLGYHALGTTDASLPVVMFAVVFGLSMDYEVLILSRIREAWVKSGDNRRAIVEGVSQTGRLVTGAALIMVVVFSAFASAPLVFVKALGIGMALAVALDATVVRMLLVPSTMALLGRLNWWRP